MESMLEAVQYLAAGLFSLAHMAAAGAGMRKSPQLSHIFMSLGSVGLLCAILASALGWGADWLIALASCGLICGAALYNGKAGGAFHLSHHIARGAFALILALGFLRL